MDGYNGQDGYNDQSSYDGYGNNNQYNGYDNSDTSGHIDSFEDYAEQNTYTAYTNKTPPVRHDSETVSTSGTSYSEYEDYDQLTPEEIEQERRRKAAARRRKLAAREARRRKRRQQAIIRCSILLLIVILLIVGFVKMITGIWNHFKDNKKPNNPTEQITENFTEEATTEDPLPEIDTTILAKDLPVDRDSAIEILTRQAETDPDLQTILDNIAVYPDDILKNLAVNSEMKQFAINYPAKINIVFKGDFNVDFTADTVPLFLLFDEQWGYADYGMDIIGLRGAGPTCLSMAYTYLKQDGSQNPIKVADFATEMGYLDENGKTTWILMTEGARRLGLGSEETEPVEDSMITALSDGKLLICSLSPGDFTRSEHFILIREYKDGLFYVNDPNSKARSQAGWDYDRLEPQITNMWVISANAPTSDDTNQDDAVQSNDTGQDNGTDDTQTSDQNSDNDTGTNQ